MKKSDDVNGFKGRFRKFWTDFKVWFTYTRVPLHHEWKGHDGWLDAKKKKAEGKMLETKYMKIFNGIKYPFTEMKNNIKKKVKR